MSPEEFFERVDKALKSTRSSDPIGCDYFCSDMEELIEEWREKSADLPRKF